MSTSLCFTKHLVTTQVYDADAHATYEYDVCTDYEVRATNMYEYHVLLRCTIVLSFRLWELWVQRCILPGVPAPPLFPVQCFLREKKKEKEKKERRKKRNYPVRRVQ